MKTTNRESSPPAAAAEKNGLQAEMLANRLTKRFRHLKKWAKRIGTDAFRLYDRDIPEIPLVLDVYGDALAGALYKRPYEKDEAEERLWLETMKTAAAAALEIEPRCIFIKTRERQRGSTQYEKIGTRSFVKEINEGGLRFKVNLSDYLDTGLFLDRRKLRSIIREAAAGKKVLNLFCYTAAFSVYAAAGGAAQTDSVDLSNTYLEWAKDNFALNGIGTDFVSEGEALKTAENNAVSVGGHRLIRADALLFLDRASAAKRRWDLIILDPPAFSNSKKMRDTLDIRRDHRELIGRCLALLSPGGKLYFSSGERKFRLDGGEFSGTAVKDLRASIVDEDFPANRAPACFLFG